MWRTTFEGPVGTLHAVADDEGLRALSWREDAWRGSTPATERDDVPLWSALRQQLEEYFRGDRTEFDLPLAPIGTDFQVAAWTALRAIPYGETRSYGEQAIAIDRPKAIRAIGAANGQNPIAIVIPCHRVIGADGRLTGFAGGLQAKRWLLDHEERIAHGGRLDFA